MFGKTTTYMYLYYICIHTPNVKETILPIFLGSLLNIFGDTTDLCRPLRIIVTLCSTHLQIYTFITNVLGETAMFLGTLLLLAARCK